MEYRRYANPSDSEEHPMRTKLKLFYKWGIQFEKQLEMPNRGSRPVYYAGRAELERAILQAFLLMFTMPTDPIEQSGKEKETVRPKATSIITSVNDG